MMNSMIKENRLSFKDLEKNIYGFICQLGRDITKNLLEEYDRELMQARDRKRYRHKGTRRTTVKTLYGEAEYERAVYQVKEEDGTKRHVFLLDEELGMSLTGLVSANMAECMVKGITEMSYRQCAEKVSEMTGQSISAMGVWNVIQSLGEKACEEEEELSEANKKGQLKGKVETPVIFEESDGVYLKLQGKDRKKSVQGKAELKVGIAYSGWRQTGKERYELQDRTAVAGFFSAKEFHEHREAVIASVFNLDEADQRILNADGASWIKKVKDQDTCFQLDPFHRNKAAREKLHDQKAYRVVVNPFCNNSGS